MQDRAVRCYAVRLNISITNSKYIIKGAAPRAMQLCGCCAARVRHNAPGVAVIVQNRAAVISSAVTITDSENIARRASPYISERYRAPLYRVIHRFPGCSAVG